MLFGISAFFGGGPSPLQVGIWFSSNEIMLFDKE